MIESMIVLLDDTAHLRREFARRERFGTRAVADDDLSLSCYPVQAQAEHCSAQADVAATSMTRTHVQRQPR